MVSLWRVLRVIIPFVLWSGILRWEENFICWFSVKASFFVFGLVGGNFHGDCEIFF
jgi:hypothetical protein